MENLHIQAPTPNTVHVSDRHIEGNCKERSYFLQAFSFSNRPLLQYQRGHLTN